MTGGQGFRTPPRLRKALADMAERRQAGSMALNGELVRIDRRTGAVVGRQELEQGQILCLCANEAAFGRLCESLEA